MTQPALFLSALYAIVGTVVRFRNTLVYMRSIDPMQMFSLFSSIRVHVTHVHCTDPKVIIVTIIIVRKMKISPRC